MPINAPDASAPPVVVWFRRDLRLDDQPALAAAVATGRPVACAFVLDPALITGVERAAARVGFLLDGLRDLDERLRRHGGGLELRHGSPDIEVPRLVRELGAVEVHACADAEPFALARDERVRAVLTRHGVPLRLHHDQTVVPHERLTRDDGTPMGTFSSYARAVGRLLDREPVTPTAVDLGGRLRPPATTAAIPDVTAFGLSGPRSDLPAGETAALDRLRWWRDSGRLERYAGHRDDVLDPDATSRLSRYLKLGMLSPRRAAQVAERAARRKFRSELLWRDWFKYVLHHHPDLAERPVDRRFAALEAPGLDEHFEAWARGETGFGLVDAGMRLMNETGFMPNRLRMVTASFMVKHLHLDWRRGERLFRDRLVDGDLSSNAGGWQWVAGTGLDAAPFFRVFNPELQERRYDPTGALVRRWAPDRPAPIVDLAAERTVALELYRRAGEGRLVGER